MITILNNVIMVGRICDSNHKMILVFDLQGFSKMNININNSQSLCLCENRFIAKWSYILAGSNRQLQVQMWSVNARRLKPIRTEGVSKPAARARAPQPWPHLLTQSLTVRRQPHNGSKHLIWNSTKKIKNNKLEILESKNQRSRDNMDFHEKTLKLPPSSTDGSRKPASKTCYTKNCIGLMNSSQTQTARLVWSRNFARKWFRNKIDSFFSLYETLCPNKASMGGVLFSKLKPLWFIDQTLGTRQQSQKKNPNCTY